MSSGWAKEHFEMVECVDQTENVPFEPPENPETDPPKTDPDEEDPDMPCRYAEDRKVSIPNPAGGAVQVHEGMAQVAAIQLLQGEIMRAMVEGMHKVLDVTAYQTGKGKLLDPNAQVGQVGKNMFVSGTQVFAKTLPGEMAGLAALNHFKAGHHQLGATPLPKNMQLPGAGTVTPQTNLEMQTQIMNQITGLIGMPVPHKIMTASGQPQVLQFRNQSDITETTQAKVSGLEQDIENLQVTVNKIAEMLEIMNGTIQSDKDNTDMLVKDAGFRVTETREPRPSVFTHVNRNKSKPEQGLFDWFKKSTVYRVKRVWADKIDKLQLGLKTHTHAEIASMSNILRPDKDGNLDIPVLGDQKYLKGKADEADEKFRRFSKSVSDPEYRGNDKVSGTAKLEIIQPAGSVSAVPAPKGGKNITS